MTLTSSVITVSSIESIHADRRKPPYWPHWQDGAKCLSYVGISHVGISHVGISYVVIQRPWQLAPQFLRIVIFHAIHEMF